MSVTITLSPDMDSFVRTAVTSGRFGSESDAVEAALRILKSQEDIVCDYTPEEMTALLDEGLKDFEEGRCEPLTDAVWQRIREDGMRILSEEQAKAGR